MLNWSWSVPISRKTRKRCSHRERHARAKARVPKFRRQALAVALVLRCRRRPCNKPPRLVRWKWKKRLMGLDLVMSLLDPSTVDSFCAADHDFLCLSHLLKT